MPEYSSISNNAPRETDSFATPDEDFSASVQEIIASRPGYFARNGTIIVFIILCCCLTGMWLIQYPDTLQGNAVLTTDPLPIQLKAQSSGRLLKIYCRDGASVQLGQPVAELENNTGVEVVLLLEAYADSVLSALQRNDENRLNTLAHTEYTTLGDGQRIYNSLIDALSTYLLQRSEHIYTRRSARLQTQINQYQSISAVSNEERRLIDEQLQQADEQFRVNEKLYQQKVISRMEYYQEAEKLRQKKLGLEAQKRSGLQNRIALTGSDKQLIDIQFEKEEKEHSQLAAIREQVRNLQNFVQDWKLKYLLTAPYKGTLHFMQPLQVNESVQAGQELCTIVPVAFRQIAYVILPASGTGKLALGQAVHIYLDQYPRNEYGYLTASVANISALPQSKDDNSFYRISAALPDSLVTSYHKKIGFRPEMTGKAIVITKDRSFLMRIIDGIWGTLQ